MRMENYLNLSGVVWLPNICTINESVNQAYSSVFNVYNR